MTSDLALKHERAQDAVRAATTVVMELRTKLREVDGDREIAASARDLLFVVSALLRQIEVDR